MEALAPTAAQAMPVLTQTAAQQAVQAVPAASEAASQAAQVLAPVVQPAVATTPYLPIAVWFILGAAFAVTLYLIIEALWKRWK